MVNSLIRDNVVHTVVEFGCGDGNQLSLANYPAYIGLDVSATAVKRCIERFKDDNAKSFFLYQPDCFVDKAGLFRSDTAISLDVIYHLVEDTVFESYMRHLFDAAKRYVLIYSTNVDASQTPGAPHVRHRRFSEYIDNNLPNWKLIRTITPDGIFGTETLVQPIAEFFMYESTRDTP